MGQLVTQEASRMNDLDTRLQLGAAYRRDPLGTIHQFDAYRRLDGANGQRVDAFLRRHGHEEASSVALRQLIESTGFGASGPEVQASLLDAAADHPDAGTIGRLRQLAADDGFQELAATGADAEIARLAGKAGPRLDAVRERTQMPLVPRNGPGVTEVAEVISHALHYAEGLAGLEVAEPLAAAVAPAAAAVVAPVVGGVLAFAGAVLGIYGPIHQAQKAHEEGAATGNAARHGSGFAQQLAELAGRGEYTPRTAAESRGAAAAERCWRDLRPSDRVALRSGEGADRFFAALDRAVLQRARGGG
jgi:hypothetical protein